MIYTSATTPQPKVANSTRAKARLSQEFMARQYPIISWELISPWSRESWDRRAALELFNHPNIQDVLKTVASTTRRTNAGKAYEHAELLSILVDYFIVHKLYREGPRMGPEKRANPGLKFPTEKEPEYTPDDACRWLFVLLRNALRDGLGKQSNRDPTGAMLEAQGTDRLATPASNDYWTEDGNDRGLDGSGVTSAERSISRYRARCKEVAEGLLFESPTHKSAALYLLFEFAELTQGILARVEHEAIHVSHGSKGLGLGRPAKDVGPAIQQWLDEYREPFTDELGTDGTFKVNRRRKGAIEKLDWILESRGESFEDWVDSAFSASRDSFNKRVRRTIKSVVKLVEAEQNHLISNEPKPPQTSGNTIVGKNGRIRRVCRTPIAKKGNSDE